MRAQTIQQLQLAIYRCEMSIERLESALDWLAFEPLSADTVRQSGSQLAFDHFRVEALLDGLMNRN